MPCSTARRASSRVSMPLMKSFSDVAFRNRSTNSQVIAGFCTVTPVMSIPSYILRSLIDGQLRAFVARRARSKVFRAGTQVGFTVAAGSVIDG